MSSGKLAVHPAEFWEGVDTIKKLNTRKLCLAASKGDCDGPIIQAHTIPRSELRKISIAGHLYHICATAGDLLANDGKYTVGKKGIAEFSVLNFFCAKHDRELFSHVENDELVCDREQLALLHYRAMGAELYKKMNGLDGARYQVELVKKRGDLSKLEFAKAYQFGSELGLRDMVRTFSKCEEIHASEDYRRVSALVIRFRKMPSIMTVGGFSPEFDFNGLPLQWLGKPEGTYEQMGLSILSSEGRAIVVFTWFSGADPCVKLARSFVSQDRNLLSTLAMQAAFEHLENTCMNIDWWDGLKEIERSKLLERMQFGGSPFSGRAASCLQYCGITFDQWEYENHAFVD